MYCRIVWEIEKCKKDRGKFQSKSIHYQNDEKILR